MPVPKFIAIGDVATDAFIRLDEAQVACTEHAQNLCRLCIKFGEKIPYESVTNVYGVGNSPNAAVAASRLGLTTGLIAKLGEDEIGEQTLEILKKERIDTTWVIPQSGKQTNFHYVLWYQDDRTILIKHEDFNYAWPEIAEPPDWFYLSSMGKMSEKLYPQISEYLANNQEVKLAFQPGTFQIKLGAKKLKDIYERTTVFAANREEAMRILGTTNNELVYLLKELAKLGPKIVLITNARDGAYAYDGDQAYFMPIYPNPRPPLERTGAGDAFTSTFVAALALGENFETALKMAPINSMSVVQQIGAQAGLLTREQLEKYLASAPTDYQPRKI